MIMNFSQINIPNEPLFLTQDETDILVEIAKLEREEHYATIYEPELFSTDGTCEF